MGKVQRMTNGTTGGPVFVDVNVMLDSGLGGELSVGLGFMFSP